MITDKKEKEAVFRRLLLSKEMYLHGLEHSYSDSSLDKMISIHNFHNALEVTLRAILLSYQIIIEKHLNIDFETMLNSIDSFQDFKSKKIKLPYRQELRNLNQLRNMVQHHAVEPESSTIDDWRVFTRRFLIKTFEIYFQLSFDEVSSVQFIEEKSIKSLILHAYQLQKDGDFKQSIIYAKLAFMYASYSIRDLMPEDGFNSEFFVISDIRQSVLEQVSYKVADKIEDTIRKIYYKIDESKFYSIMISSGISFVNYKKFEKETPHIDFTLDGGFVVQSAPSYKPNDEINSWILNFVEQTIIKWQLNGLDLKPNKNLKYPCSNVLSEIKLQCEQETN